MDSGCDELSHVDAGVSGSLARCTRGGEWKDEYWDGPCKVKIESKNDEYKEEIKCPNGRGASWRHGEWKDEFREHGCKVKIEAKRDEYKKEVKCDDD